MRRSEHFSAEEMSQKKRKTSRKRCHGDDMMKRERRRANGKVRRMGP
jgi:hypothetical protein